ncbi:MAG: hypothetical protein KC506_02375 [Nanoarchaeota archaeon]|nr:hypothetical protein [Nanoarchaeota archaeon]
MKKEHVMKIYLALFVTLLTFSSIQFVVAQDLAPSGSLEPEQYARVEKLLDNWFIRLLVGNPGESADKFIGENYKLGVTGALISHLALWAMMFVLFSDIFGGFLPLQNKAVPWILGGGLTIIIANFGFIPRILYWTVTVVGFAGAFSAVVAMLIAFGGFILATIMGNWVKYHIMRGKKEWAGKAGAHDAGRAVGNLVALEKSMEKAGSS